MHTLKKHQQILISDLHNIIQKEFNTNKEQLN